MARLVLFWGCLLILLHPSLAQPGFLTVAGRKTVEIPFEYTNNFIILSLNFGGYLPLKFIFDTGAEHTILTKRELSDLLRVQYEREFRVAGSDLKTVLVAYLARRLRFDIPEKVYAPSEDILVLQDDYFRFEEYAGVNVHGILSANAFSRYVIKINYDRRTITLYERETFKLREEGYIPVPVEMFRNKMYLNTTLQVLPDSVAAVKLLLDTGAGLPLLLFSNTHPLIHPPQQVLPSNIGMGLGGYLEGYTGRIHQIDMGGMNQSGVITYFQELDTTVNLEYLNNRDGLIGNALLNRFQVILDYEAAKIWLKPGKYFKAEYIYDRSGLSVVATGPRFNEFIVQNILPNSPAAEADIRRDDQIVRVGNSPASFFTLSDLQRLFQKKAGKRIKLTVKRGDQRIKKVLVLRDLI